MNPTKEAREIIRTLEENNFYVECPCCGEQTLLKDAGLFYLDDFSPEAEKLYQQRLKECKVREKEILEERKAISRRSEIATTTIDIGFILERIAPTMRDFRFDRDDCRSLFPSDGNPYSDFIPFSQKPTRFLDDKILKKIFGRSHDQRFVRRNEE